MLRQSQSAGILGNKGGVKDNVNRDSHANKDNRKAKQRPMATMVIANKRKAEQHDRQLRHASTRADLGLFAASLKPEQQTEMKRRVQERVDDITNRLQARATLRR